MIKGFNEDFIKKVFKYSFYACLSLIAIFLIDNKLLFALSSAIGFLFSFSLLKGTEISINKFLSKDKNKNFIFYFFMLKLFFASIMIYLVVKSNVLNLAVFTAGMALPSVIIFILGINKLSSANNKNENMEVHN